VVDQGRVNRAAFLIEKDRDVLAPEVQVVSVEVPRTRRERLHAPQC
jgi:hypothetical protein